jgi:tetratricopeptide (TPR) repeat protein
MKTRNKAYATWREATWLQRIAQILILNMNLISKKLILKVSVFLIVGIGLITWSYPTVFSLRYQFEGERLLIPILVEEKSTSDGLCFNASPQLVKVYESQVNRAIHNLHLSQTYASSPASSLLLAKAYCWLGEPEEAEIVIRQYGSLRPNNLSGRLEWWRSLGLSLQEEKKWDEAVTLYKQALAEFPNIPDLHENLGVALYRRGDGLDPAKQEIQRAISIEPQGQFYVMIGELLTQEKRFEEADIWYHKGIEVEPTIPWWYELRADNMGGSGDWASALEMYKDIVNRFPDYAPAYLQMAWTYRINGQQDSSIEAIERALLLMNPPEPLFYVSAGEIYEWAGQTQKANEAYRQALVLDPTNESAIQGVSRLGSQK